MHERKHGAEHIPKEFGAPTTRVVNSLVALMLLAIPVAAAALLTAAVDKGEVCVVI